MFTEEEKIYLRNKHTGGFNNAKGGLYEDFYALFQIVVSCATYKGKYENVIISSQLEECFVDDLFSKDPDGLERYFQLKNTQSLSWGNDSIRNLTYDFRRQHEIVKNKGNDCILELGVSNQCVYQYMNDTIPHSIKKFTRVYHLPYYENISRFILENEYFKIKLEEISGYNEPCYDNLEVLAITILGVWRGLGSTTKHTLDGIVKGVNRITKPGVNFSWMDDIEIKEDTKRILSKIPNFHYRIQHSVFEWCYGFEKGELNTEQFDVFEKYILEHPMIDSFDDLEEFLMV